jgi:hypothetical protein
MNFYGLHIIYLVLSYSLFIVRLELHYIYANPPLSVAGKDKIARTGDRHDNMESVINRLSDCREVVIKGKLSHRMGRDGVNVKLIIDKPGGRHSLIELLPFWVKMGQDNYNEN